MTDTDQRLTTALANSSERVYESTREFEGFVEDEKRRLKEAADREVSSGLQQQVDAALTGTMQSESDAQEAARQAIEHLDATTEALEEAKRLLNIATDVAWGATHDNSAKDDHKAANRMRFVAFCMYVLAAAVAVMFASSTSENPPDGWEWLEQSVVGGPVAILLWAAAYASRESRDHRNSARLFKHQSLALNSLDQYAGRIERTYQVPGAGEAAAFLKETAKSLFTNQIDAHVDQIKTQGRKGCFTRRPRREDPSQN